MKKIYHYFHIWEVLGGPYVKPKDSGQYDLMTEQTYV